MNILLKPQLLIMMRYEYDGQKFILLTLSHALVVRNAASICIQILMWLSYWTSWDVLLLLLAPAYIYLCMYDVSYFAHLQCLYSACLSFLIMFVHCYAVGGKWRATSNTWELFILSLQNTAMRIVMRDTITLIVRTFTFIDVFWFFRLGNFGVMLTPPSSCLTRKSRSWVDTRTQLTYVSWLTHFLYIHVIQQDKYVVNLFLLSSNTPPRLIEGAPILSWWGTLHTHTHKLLLLSLKGGPTLG